MASHTNMFEYEFPEIHHIDEVLNAIEGRDEFIVKHDIEGNYKTINYLVNYEDTFPIVRTKEDAILRECRGLTFNATTGEIIQRKFHKFFNILERSETHIDQIDITAPHIILEKLDGSMAVPIWVGNTADINWKHIKWTTKMGLTDVAKQIDEFVNRNQHYNRWSAMCMASGFTPIFEYCSRRQRIVIDYPEDRLVLTAIRHNVSGKYHSYDEMKKAELSGIEVVRALPGSIQNMEQFINQTQQLEDIEGFVVAFKSGHRFKIKTETYCALHRTLEHFNHEKDVIRLILDDKLDDVKGVLPVDLASKADAFTKQIFDGIVSVADTVYWIAQAEYDNLNGSKKRFAIEVANGHEFSSFLFSAFKMLDEYPSTANGQLYVHNLVKEYVKKQCGSQTNVNRIRNIIGSKTWQDYVNIKEE